MWLALSIDGSGFFPIGQSIACLCAGGTTVVFTGQIKGLGNTGRGGARMIVYDARPGVVEQAALSS